MSVNQVTDNGDITKIESIRQRFMDMFVQTFN